MSSPPPPTGTRLLTRSAPHDPHRNSTGAVGSPSEFLKSIGRSTDTKVKVEKWDEFWKLDGSELKKQGLDVKDRR